MSQKNKPCLGLWLSMVTLTGLRNYEGFTKESGGFRGESLGNLEVSATALPNDYFQHTSQYFCIILWYFRCARPEVQRKLYFGQYSPPSQILRRGFVKREVQSVTAVQCLSCLVPLERWVLVLPFI